MRVALIGQLRGGVGVYARGLATALLAADPGLELDLVTADEPPPALAGERFSVHRIGRLGRFGARLPTHPGWYLEARCYAAAVRRLPAAVDLLHFVDARTALWAVGSAAAGRPVVGTMNDYFYATTDARDVRSLYRDWPPRLLLYALTRAGERRALRRVDRVIAISAAVAREVGGAYGLPTARFAVVPYGFEFPRRAPVPRPAGAPATIVFVGGNFQRKGLFVLLRAMPAVLAARPDARLVVVGDSLGAAAARRLARRLGVASNVTFAGRIDYAALWRLYGEAAVVTMPSLREAFGIPYLEGMSLGVPVVATACGGPDEFLRDGENAVVVPPGDAAALADGLLRALGDEALRARLRDGGPATAARFTAPRMARETLAVYRDTQAAAGARRGAG